MHAGSLAGALTLRIYKGIYVSAVIAGRAECGPEYPRRKSRPPSIASAIVHHPSVFGEIVGRVCLDGTSLHTVTLSRSYRSGARPHGLAEGGATDKLPP